MSYPRAHWSRILPLCLVSLWICRCDLPAELTGIYSDDSLASNAFETGTARPDAAADDVPSNSLNTIAAPTAEKSELSRVYGASTWENPEWTAKNEAAPRNDQRPATTAAASGSRPPDSGNQFTAEFNSQTVQDVAGIPVLCYHQIEAGDKSYGGFNVSPERFEEQLRYLRQAGYQSLSQTQFIDLLAGRVQPGRGGIPERGIVLSFDDGLISHYRTAAPLLKRYGFRGLLFLYPTVLSSKRAAYMNWKQARELVQSGVFEVGSHSLYHPFLPELTPKQLASQMRDSRKTLERRLGVTIQSFAYPFGAYDRRVIAAARAAEYELAFTINTGSVFPPVARNQRLTLNRYMVTRADSLERFRSNLKLQAPRRIALDPPDGSHIRPGADFRLTLTDVRPDSVRVRLGSREIKVQNTGTAFTGRLSGFKSSRGYLPLEVRATRRDGTRVFQRFLYLDAQKF